MNVVRRRVAGKYKLTVDDFLRLDEAGVFGTDRTELLDGDIIIMNAEYRPHAWITGELAYSLRRVLTSIGSDLHAMSASVALSDHDMPLPDIVLTREPRGEGPIPLASIALIVEVSSSTLQRDLNDKAAMYARTGIPEYWVVDVEKRVVYRMSTPEGGRYVDHEQATFGEVVTAVTIPGLTIETDAL